MGHRVSAGSNPAGPIRFCGESRRFISGGLIRSNGLLENEQLLGEYIAGNWLPVLRIAQNGNSPDSGLSLHTVRISNRFKLIVPLVQLAYNIVLPLIPEA